jgi:hypothetical protein
MGVRQLLVVNPQTWQRSIDQQGAHMRYKAVFALGIATGYVLGARAGRQRYEQIKRMTKSISGSAPVQHTAATVQTQAAALSSQARRAAQTKAGAVGHDLLDKVTARLPVGVSARFGHHTIDLDAETSKANGSMT